MARQKVVNGVYYDLTPEEEAELATQAEAADLDLGFVRSRRNGMLSSCDWTQIGDATLGDHTAEEWRTYRQALKDIPQNYTLKISFYPIQVGHKENSHLSDGRGFSDILYIRRIFL